MKRFEAVLSSFVRNDKKIIDTLTKLAEANRNAAKLFVDSVIKNKTNVNGLLILYLMDSIIKNAGGNYVAIFSAFVICTFKEVFEVVDVETKKKMFLLRVTWENVFPETILATLDETILQIDRNWPALKKQHTEFKVEKSTVHVKVRTYSHSDLTAVFQCLFVSSKASVDVIPKLGQSDRKGKAEDEVVVADLFDDVRDLLLDEEQVCIT